MKIGILTQSMSANYGCNLQAYALQTTLERMGHKVEILNRWRANKKVPLKELIVNASVLFIKDFIKLLLRRPIYHAIEEEDRCYYWQHILRFQEEYLHLSKIIKSSAELKNYTDSYPFDVFVVGSDQVWRPAYNLGEQLFDMYVNFAKDLQVQRLSYAASFGVDDWEYSDEQTRVCAELAKLFDAISVREKSGIKLCKDNLGVDAKLVLDPTLLLDACDYNILIEKKLSEKVEGGLFCYILDSSESTLRTMDYVEKVTGLKRFICLPLIPENSYNVFNKKGCILPSPEEWLRSFRDAEMVLVDSYHGMVFSIIYNKPFWVIGNAKRGLARFHSLLSLFNLENRLLSLEQIQTIDLHQSINWDFVNARRAEMIAESKNFLLNNLSQTKGKCN